MRRYLRRALNGIRKVAAGLTPFGESVWPGVPNDLFVAHVSIYRFFAEYVSGRDVLDAGCGTGYGSNLLGAEARTVTGIDVDGRSIAYARHHFASETVSYEVADLDSTLPFEDDLFDLVVSSNALEHLRHPAAAIHELARVLRPGGTALIAVPPIVDEATREEHHKIHYHRSALTVDQWLSLFNAADVAITIWRHDAPKASPDFSSPYPSQLSSDAYSFEPSSRDDLYTRPSITAVFELRF